MKNCGGTFLVLATVIVLICSEESPEASLASRRPNRIQAFRVRMSDDPHADTNGNLLFGVQQGSTRCETASNTVVKPQNTLVYEVNDGTLFGTCPGLRKPFDPTSKEPIQIRVLSTTKNVALIDKVGIKINGEWYSWEDEKVPIQKKVPSDWRRVFASDIEGGVAVRSFSLTMSDTRHALTKGSLRIGIKQGLYTSCETDIDLVVDPQRKQRYILSNREKFGTCLDTKFNPDVKEPIEVRVLSKSRTSAFFDEVKIKIKGVWMGWTGARTEVSNGHPSDWETVQ